MFRKISPWRSDYTRYFNQVWYTAQETDNHHTGTCQIHLSWKSKMAAAAILIFERCFSELDEDISTKFGEQMHHGHTDMIAGTLITLSRTAIWLHVLDRLLPSSTTSSCQSSPLTSSLVATLILSRLDYYNTLLAELPRTRL